MMKSAFFSCAGLLAVTLHVVDSRAGTALVSGGDGLIRIDLTTGAGAVIASPAAGLSPPLESIAIEVRGTSALLVEEGSDELSRVDLATGAVTLIASGLAEAEAVAIEAGGATALVVEEFTHNLVRVNLTTGAKSIVASDIDPGFQLEEALEIEAGGKTVLLTNEGTGNILRVELATGAWSVVASDLERIEGLTLEAGGGTVLAALNSSHGFRSDDQLVRVDLATGLITSIIAQTPDLRCVQVPRIEPGGATVLITESCAGRLSRVDLATGTVTTVVSGLNNPEGLAIERCEGVATRTLPPVYAPGEPAPVSITIQPDPNALAQAVEDVPPAGWTVSEISDGGRFDDVNGKVKWGPFFDHEPRTLSYNATPPAGATGGQCFGRGEVSFDGVDRPICPQCVSPCGPHPADENSDFRMVIAEVTAYGAAWGRGDIWPVPPNTIPIGYVTRAGFLWRAGERYCCDVSSGQGAPLIWVVDCPNVPSTRRRTAAAEGARIAPAVVTRRTFRAVQYIPGQPVGATIVATPPAGAFVYAVVDAPPLGWEVARISDGGQFDGANGKVKWGPFFDDQPRVLYYEVTPPGQASGCQSFRALISIDGADTPIADRQIHPRGDTDCDVSPGSPDPPALVSITDSLRGVNAARGSADTFISPLGESCALSSFSLDATEPLMLDDVATIYTGPGTVPNATWVDDGGGRHTVHLDPPPEPGHWLKLDMHVTSKSTGVSAPVTVWVALQPLDINGDGRSDRRDATAFGAEFSSGDNTAPIDINCDGTVNTRDATAFGTNWNAGWANTELPPKP